MTPTPDALDRPSAQVGFRPIPFEATTTDGRRVRFPEDFAGRYVLLDFWSLSCPPCLMDIRDHYLRDYAAYREAGFEILGVARNTDEDLRGNLPDLGIVWPVVADRPEGRITGCYRVDAYPTLYLIDPRGRIVAEGSDLRGERLSRWLRAGLSRGTTLAGRPNSGLPDGDAACTANGATACDTGQRSAPAVSLTMSLHSGCRLM